MLEALERIERQLVDAAAQQRPAPQTRRALPRGRRLALAAVAALVLASGASAITGVGPIGDLFDAEEIGLAPRPGEPSVTVSQQRPDGTTAAMRAYQDKNGAICIQSPPVTGRPASEVAVSCAPAPDIRRLVEREAVFAATAVTPDGAQFYGLVPRETEALRVEVEGQPPADAALADQVIAGFRPFLVTLAGDAPDITNPARLIFEDGREARWPPEG